MSKTISVYTATSNAIKNEYCIIEGIKSALLFADEVIVVDSFSTDNTVELIKRIGDSRIKIYYNEWLESIGRGMYATQKNMSLGRCTSDWCVLMDSDEVFHENDIQKIKSVLDFSTEDIVAIKFNTVHFYNGYTHILNNSNVWKDLYNSKIYAIRNGLGIHHGAIGEEVDAHVMNNCLPIPQDKTINSSINIYHYGHSRSKQCYINKINTIEKRHFCGKAIDFKPIDEKIFSPIQEWRLIKFSGTHPDVMNKRISVGLNSHEKIEELYAC